MVAITMNDYISAEEAADILNISVLWFMTDVAPEITDKIYYYGVTQYSRLNVLAWKLNRDEKRRQALDELAAMSQELGL
jgi:hypothetical protein